MGILTAAAKAAAKAAKAKKVAAKLAAAKKAAAAKKKTAQRKTGLKTSGKSKFATPKQIRDADRKGMLLSNDPDIERKFDEAVEAYEAGRLDSFTNPPERSPAGAKKFKARNKRNASQVNLNAARENAAEKAAAKKAKQKRKGTSKVDKFGRPKTKPKKTFLSEMRELKSKLMTAAAFQREASKLAVKYGKTIKIAGKVFGPKKKPKKGPPISRERIPGVKRDKKGRIIDRNGT
tara:strand:+ start:205 stop:906 length:702 start_codon:yes stop_codon:yes gene_type:complete